MAGSEVNIAAHIDRAQSRLKKQDAGAKIAAIKQLVHIRRARTDTGLAAADPAEGFAEGRRIAGDPRGPLGMELPKRAPRIELANRDLVQEIGEARRVGRIRASPPDLADTGAQPVGQREEPGAALSPPQGPLVATFAFGLVPPDGAAGHFLVDAVLTGGDLIGEERQRLAFEALLAEKRRTLARRVTIGFGSMPAAEAHQTPSRRARAAA